MLRRTLSIGLPLLALVAGPSTARAYGFDDAEEAFQFQYLSKPIAVEGRVVDEWGTSLEGAQLRLIGWGEGFINDGEATTSWTGGSFELTGLARRNALLEVSLDGYYTEVYPIELQRPIDEDVVELSDIVLIAEQFGRARLSFAGDAMFGRRMFDDGLLSQATLTADTEALFRYIEPVLWADDHTAINLETPVTDHLLTPHPSKTFVFNAFPGSAAALPKVGVDSVSLGNNHVYDYMAVGLIDTLDYLAELGIPHYGAGLDRSDAAASIHRTTINGVALSLQGFNDISGASHGANSLKLIALDNPRKPGALHANPEEIGAFVKGEVAKNRVAIPIIHGGTEYVESQSLDVRADIRLAIDRGATMVVAHHPHVVHGVQLIRGDAGSRFVFGSLGNFIFDQEIYETLRSYIAVVDVSDRGSRPVVERVRLVPIVRDDYVPRLLVGDAVAKFGRKIAQLSTDEAALSSFDAAIVFAEDGRLVVAADDSALTIDDLLDTRTLALAHGETGVVALEPYTSTDALAALHSKSPATCELGRDLLGIGDFEDSDVDSYANEGDLWARSDSRYIEGLDVHAGTGAAVLLRHASQAGATTLSMLRPVAVSVGRKMTIHGWYAADNAGALSLRVRWLRADANTLSHSTESLHAGKTFDWSPFAVDLSVPPGAATLVIDLVMESPAVGEGRLLVDDLSFIEWAPKPLDVRASGVELPTPNGWDFVRCEAAGNSLELALIHRTYATGPRRLVPRLPNHPTRILAP